LIARTQELLIVTPEGRATSALLSGMTAFDNCFVLGRCESPVPVVSGTIGRAPGRLGVGNRIDHPIGRFADDERVDREIVAAVRARMALAREMRPIEVTQGGRQLVLTAHQDGASRRVLARIEPARLKALWSIFRVSDQPTNPGWRCLLAHATADEPAFAALRRGNERVPAGLEAAGRAAGVLSRINDLMRMPVPDERDDTYLAMADRPFEHGMSEPLPGLDRPRDEAERTRLEDRHAILMLWLTGAIQRAEAETLVRALGPAAAPLSITEDEMDALRRLVLPGAEASRVFCAAL
jgi:hypothetical protein